MLSDLGYLWDHTERIKTVRTFAHNTVMIDGKDQITKGRGGRFTLFARGRPLGLMEAESTAYAEATRYRRTVAQVERPDAGAYVLDIFRVAGGRRHEYVFHGPNREVAISGAEFRAAELGQARVRFAVRFHLSSPGAEVFVDEMEIAGPDGRNLLTNPSGAAINPKTAKPAGWGAYQGDGRLDWGRADCGRNGKPCVRLKAVKPGTSLTNVALLAGESDGYRGGNALPGVAGQSYRISFWLRGTAPMLQSEVVYWPADPSSPDNRHHATIEGLTLGPAPSGWTRFAGRVTLPGAMELANVRACEAHAPVRLTWNMSGGRKFHALWENEPGETSLLGDGWGTA